MIHQKQAYTQITPHLPIPSRSRDGEGGLTFDLGGMVWKGEVEAQRLTMERMDPNTADLIKKVKGLLDPHGIMNPGNWEKDE